MLGRLKCDVKLNEAIFLECCQDFPSHLNSIGWATRPIWVAVKNTWIAESLAIHWIIFVSGFLCWHMKICAEFWWANATIWQISVSCECFYSEMSTQAEGTSLLWGVHCDSPSDLRNEVCVVCETLQMNNSFIEWTLLWQLTFLWCGVIMHFYSRWNNSDFNRSCWH